MSLLFSIHQVIEGIGTLLIVIGVRVQKMVVEIKRLGLD